MESSLETAENAYRIFLSYSHKDTDLLKRVEGVLKEIEMKPMSDQRLAYGHGFLDQIKAYIAHAHVFMPLVTPNSIHGQWVQQELGFATALSVPVFPICIGDPPSGMIQASHSLILQSPDDPALEEKLTRTAFSTLISWVARYSRPYYECAESVEERALMLADYADQVRDIGKPQFLRQSGGLSSFSVPDEPPEHPTWNQRYGGRWRPPFSYKCLRKERQSLEAHARFAGCKLLIHHGVELDNNYDGVEGHGPGAKYTRLRTLIEFLESMPDDMVRIALVAEARRHSLVLVGDWFAAEAVTGNMKTGYRNTLFTRHVAAVQHHLREFDQMFETRVREGAELPRKDAIAKLRAVMKDCKPPPESDLKADCYK